MGHGSRARSDRPTLVGLERVLQTNRFLCPGRRPRGRHHAHQHTLEWVRILAASVFLVFGVVPILIAALRSLARRDAPHTAA